MEAIKEKASSEPALATTRRPMMAISVTTQTKKVALVSKVADRLESVRAGASS
jgi:hypothetical protein